MNQDFATAIASEVYRCLGVKATPYFNGVSWCIELTLPNGEPVVLTDAVDWTYLLEEQRSLGLAA